MKQVRGQASPPHLLIQLRPLILLTFQNIYSIMDTSFTFPEDLSALRKMTIPMTLPEPQFPSPAYEMSSLIDAFCVLRAAAIYSLSFPCQHLFQNNSLRFLSFILPPLVILRAFLSYKKTFASRISSNLKNSIPLLLNCSYFFSLCLARCSYLPVHHFNLPLCCFLLLNKAMSHFLSPIPNHPIPDCPIPNCQFPLLSMIYLRPSNEGEMGNCWNWQTGVTQDHVPQGVRVQLPHSPYQKKFEPRRTRSTRRLQNNHRLRYSH